MIYVNQKQLDQVEYLIEQSAKGHHILFDLDTIRRVFGVETYEQFKAEHLSSIEDSEVDETAEKHIEKLILQPTLVSKKAYLENLKPELFKRVVKTYFSIVENNIFENQKFVQ